ncbi:Kinase-like protein [Mycena venus]|uniref:non-specific serine/threonine protein kinase n=1 Tax=Mycena venus TaxID=2733690 RepID=A0A8H7CZP8_9AGAR|nr:Kinase-like protein [Mycena venus]
MDFTFGGKYRLEEEIAVGGCGQVFLGVHTIAGKEVAIKLEPAIAKHGPLKQESKIYKTLMGGTGVPWVMWSGRQGDYNVMVIDLLGPSLEDLFKMCNRHFSPKTVLLLADQLISRIEFIHTHGLVHRDVKPANVLTQLVQPTTSSSIPYQSCTISHFVTSNYVSILEACSHPVQRRPPFTHTTRQHERYT